MHTLNTLAAVVLFCLALTACGDDDGDATPTPGASVTSVASPTPTSSTQPNGLPADRVTFYGAEAGDQAGAVVSGDFNGDGFADVVLGAFSADGPDNQRVDSGEAHVFHGPFEPGASLDAGADDADIVFFGEEDGASLGRALAVGDFNGDGADDLALGSPTADAEAGRVYVMYGGDWPEEIDFASADPDVLITGADAGDYAGLMLATSDLDANGADELLIASILADGPQNAREDAGEVYVLPGETLIDGSTIALAQTASVVYGARAGDHLGEGLTSGDIDGDGTTDLVVVGTFSAGPDASRDGAGQAYVITSAATFPLDLATSSPALQVIGADAGDQLGHSIGAGDTDGDGADDVWLGAVSADGDGNATDLAGEAVLVIGKRPPGTVIDAGAGDADAIIYGPEHEARLGRSLAVGDLSGDGLADLAISAPNLDARAGHIFIVNAGGAYPDDADGADIRLGGLDEGDTLGFEAFGTPSLSVTDVDGDDRIDLLVSAPGGDGPDNGRADSGEAYVIFGATLGS